MKKRFISMLLVLLLTLNLCVMPASAERSGGTPYKTVFLHGILGWGFNDGLSRVMNYWGLTSGNMLAYLRSEGYDVVDAAVGPISSDHDRCCELFAQLTGTVTDYGAAHSAAVEKALAGQDSRLKHERFGRDYGGKAIVEHWGPVYKDGRVTGWYDNKINLVGHSMGGPTGAMFLQLLAEGDAAERSWGREQAAKYGGDWHDYVSPLFWGDYDGEYLIHSFTTLAGALNGTDITSCCKNSIEFIMMLVGELASMTGRTDIAYLYDFQLEHFGITNVPGRAMSDSEFFNSAEVKQFLNCYDCAPYDVTVQRTNELKQGWETYKNIYYFSYAGDCTHSDPLTGKRVPDADMLAVLIPFAAKMCSGDYAFEQVKDIHGRYVSSIDSTWQPNDGVVNTVSARYPLGAAQKPYDAEAIEAGIWQWQDLRYDHMTFVGGLLDPKLLTKPREMRSFFDKIMSDISDSTPIEKDAEPFTDIRGSVHHDAIVKAAESGIAAGYADGTFRPNAAVTRAQFITMLWRAAGSPAANAEIRFSDRDSIAPGFRAAVRWGVSEGIIAGFSDGSFRPNAAVTRAQMAAFVYRYMKNVAGFDFGSVTPGSFADSAGIAPAYREAVNAMASCGILLGTGHGCFSPNTAATRGMAASVLVRMLAAS